MDTLLGFTTPSSCVHHFQYRWEFFILLSEFHFKIHYSENILNKMIKINHKHPLSSHLECNYSEIFYPHFQKKLLNLASFTTTSKYAFQIREQYDILNIDEQFLYTNIVNYHIIYRAEAKYNDLKFKNNLNSKSYM